MSVLAEPEATRADIALALTYVNASAKRCPAHYSLQWAKWHEEINNLLDQYQAAP